MTRDIHQQLKLAVTAIASIVLTGVLGALLLFASIQVGFFTPPMGEYRLGPLEVISLREKHACLPNQVCAAGAYTLYLGFRMPDSTSLGMPVIYRQPQ